MTHREETEAIRGILLGICERWKAEEEPVDLEETVILGPGGSQREEKAHSPPPSSAEKDREFITETVLLSPKGGVGNSSIPSPGVPPEDQGMVETVIVSRDRWEGNLPKKAAAKPAGEDILAETVILGGEREPKPKTNTEKDGSRK